MRFFQVDEKQESYKQPIIKILICTAVCTLCVCRGYLFPIENTAIRVIVSILCFLIIIPAILCLELSFCELIMVSENKKKKRDIHIPIAPTDGKRMSCAEVFAMIDQNDIIDIKINYQGRHVSIGSSSDYHRGRDKFFDKRFYISIREFLTPESFLVELESYAVDGHLLVWEIDGIKQQ